jgi:hypothetical protein
MILEIAHRQSQLVALISVGGRPKFICIAQCGLATWTLWHSYGLKSLTLVPSNLRKHTMYLTKYLKDDLFAYRFYKITTCSLSSIQNHDGSCECHFHQNRMFQLPRNRASPHNNENRLENDLNRVQEMVERTFHGRRSNFLQKNKCFVDLFS